MQEDQERNKGENTGHKYSVAVVCESPVLRALIEQVLSFSAHDFMAVNIHEGEEGQNSAYDEKDFSLIVSDNIPALEAMNHLPCPKILLKKGRSEAESPESLPNIMSSCFVEIALPVRWGTFSKRLENMIFSSLNVQDIRFSGYHLSGAHSLLTQEDTGEVKRLTEKERDMLLFFYRNRDRAVSREEILAHVWGYADTAETHTVETHIYRLRQKIEKDPASPEIVITDDEGYKILF